MPRPNRISLCCLGWITLLAVVVSTTTDASAEPPDGATAEATTPAASSARAAFDRHRRPTPRGLDPGEVGDRSDALRTALRNSRPEWPSIHTALRTPSTLRWTSPAVLVRTDFTPSIAPSPIFDPGAVLADLERTADRMTRMLRLVGPRPSLLVESEATRTPSAPTPLRALLVPGWFHGPAAHLRLEF